MAAITDRKTLKQYLAQLEGHPEDDTLLEALLRRAQSIIESYLGFAYDAWPESPTEKVVYGTGNSILTLPAHQVGSITAVKNYADDSVIDPTTYAENDEGHLYLLPGFPTQYTLSWGPTWGGYWGTSRYKVTAKWGYGPAPEAVVEVCLELAKNLFFEKDQKGSTDIVGIEGEGGVAVGYLGAFSKRQRMILDTQRSRFFGRGLF